MANNENFDCRQCGAHFHSREELDKHNRQQHTQQASSGSSNVSGSSGFSGSSGSSGSSGLSGSSNLHGDSSSIDANRDTKRDTNR